MAGRSGSALRAWSGVVPVSPWPGSTCVAPPSASAAITLRRRGARRIDDEAAAALPREPLCGLAQGGEIGRGPRFARALVEEQGGEGGEPGEAPARRGVERIRHGLDLARVEAPFVAGIEGIARRLDARDQRLLVALRVRRRRGFSRAFSSLKTVQ